MSEQPPSTHTEGSIPIKSLGIEIFQKSAWLLSQEGADLLLAFVFTFVALRRLGPEYFGLLNLTQASLNLSGLATFNLELALIRLVPEARGLHRWGLARWMVGLAGFVKGGLAILVALILFSTAPIIASYFNQSELILMIRIGCLSLISAAIADVGAAACLSLLHPEVRAYVTTLRRSLEVAGLILVTSLRSQVSDAVLVLAVADTFAALAYTGATIWFLRRDPDSEADIDQQNAFLRMWHYAYPLFGARLTDVGGRELGKLFLGRVATASAVGYYSVARLTIERLTTLMAQAPLAAVPVIAQAQAGEDGSSNQQTNRETMNLMKYQMIAANIGGLIIWAITPLFIQIIGGSDYGLAIPALRILTFGLIFWSGTAALHALFLVHERTAGIFFLNSTLILTTIAFYGFFVARWQTNGAAASDSLGQLFTLLLGLAIGWRWFGYPASEGLKLAGQIILPATLLGLPVLFIPQNLAFELMWLAISISLYLTYLLFFGFIPASLWDQIESLSLPNLPGLSGFRKVLLSGMRRYQSWLFTVRDRVFQ